MLLHIFNNIVVKNVGKNSVKLLQFSLMYFLSQKAQTSHAYVKISSGPRKFGREIVRTVFHNHLHFPVVNFIPIAKNILPLAVIFELSVYHQCRLELWERTAKGKDQWLWPPCWEFCFHPCKIHPANRELPCLGVFFRNDLSKQIRKKI